MRYNRKMRVLVFVNATIRPRIPKIIRDQASCPEELLPKVEAHDWWTPFPFVTTHSPNGFQPIYRNGKMTGDYLDRDLSKIDDSDIVDIVAGLTSLKDEIVIETICTLARKHGFLALENYNPEPHSIYGRIGESVSDWKAFGIWVKSIVEIGDALRTRDRQTIVDQLSETAQLSSKYVACIPYIKNATGFNDLSFEKFEQSPKAFSDELVFDMAIGIMRTLAKSLHPTSQTFSWAQGLEPELVKYLGQLEFALVSKSFRGAVATYLLLAMSADPTLFGIDSESGVGLPRLCANSLCRLPFSRTHGNRLYAGAVLASCRGENKRGGICKYARGILGYS
jgi:hypothetical protein